MSNNIALLLLEKIKDKEGVETFLSTCMKLLSLPDASHVRRYVLAHLVLLPILVVYHYAGVFVSSPLIIAAILAILYVLFPDVIPGPIDDIMLISVAVTVPISAVRGFAEWISKKEEPPSLGIFGVLPETPREKAESFLYHTAREYAQVILSAEQMGEETGNEEGERLIRMVYEQLMLEGRKRQSNG